jgi:methyltransferase-like protein/SAM-dependent methyltransferase
MTETLPASSYDLAPYPRLSHSYSHPDKAAALACLLGLTPPPVEHCRVLELGCASGGNLIPLAQAFPESKFVGLDLSGRQVAIGQADIEALGLKNIRLHQRDLLSVDAGFGLFDYIVAHGLYSWVPLPVRDKLLTVCHKNLAADGVAYVSYNVYPGWHSLDAIRQMMLYHVREETELAQRAAGARDLLSFLAGAADPADYYGAMLASHDAFLKQELSGRAANNDAYLLHDHLEEINEPVYFHQFAEHAARHELQYLCDADFRMDFLTSFPKPTADSLLKMSRNIVELEQYADFVRNRMFRQTLLVHAGQPVNRRLSSERLKNLWVGSPALPESGDANVRTVAVEKFVGRDEAKLAIDHPLSKAALVCLARRWPAYLPFDALVAEAQALLEASDGEAPWPAASATPVPAEQVEVLAGNLLQAYTYSESLAEFHACPPRFTLEVSNTPLASPWARRQTAYGTSVTNLRHERLTLGPLQFHLLRLLDGARDRAALLAALEKPVADGEIAAKQNDQIVTDFQQNMEILAASLDAKLEGLARAALLVA